MIIKSFAADSVSGCLKKVRAEMGGDAVVLNTRQINDSGRMGVEVTACIDSDANTPTSVITPSSNRKASPEEKPLLSEQTEKSVAIKIEDPSEIIQTLPRPTSIAEDSSITESPALKEQLSAIEARLRGIENMWTVLKPSMQSVPEPLQKMQNALRDSDLPVSYIDNLFRTALSEKTNLRGAIEAIETTLSNDIKNIFDNQFHVVAGDRVLFIGPPGSGKTTVMGKMAAQLVCKEKIKVTFMSLCASKVGAIDELKSYAVILDSEVIVADATENLKAPTDDVVTLIDTAAATVKGQPNAELLVSINRLQPSIRIAVFSSLIRTNDATRLLDELAPYAITHLAITMTDLADRWGAALTLCKKTGIKLVLVNDSPSGVGMLASPDASIMVKSLLASGGISHE